MQNINTARQTAQGTMELMGMYGRGTSQLKKYGIFYGVVVLVVFLFISIAVRWPASRYLDKGWIGIVVFFLLCIILGIYIYRNGGFEGAENIVYFRTALGAAYTTAGSGRTQNIPFLQRISEDGVSLQRREVPVETEIEIPGQPTVQANAGQPANTGHPQTKVMFSMRIYFDVINAALYMFLMPGETTEQKGNVLAAVIKDALQSAAHALRLDEPAVLALSGDTILGYAESGTHGTPLSEIAEQFGIRIERLVVDETNIDPLIEELRIKVYEGDMEGQAYLAQVGHMVLGAFGKDMDSMTPEDFEKLREHKERIDFIAGMKSGDKTILNIQGLLGNLFSGS